MKKKLFVFASLLMAISLVLSGCGAPPTPQVIEKEVPVEVTKVVQVEVTAQPADGGEIAVIVKTGNSSFWQNVQTGAMDAQDELKETLRS
jgi:ABC-type sugar transport system substrate-binding protein